MLDITGVGLLFLKRMKNIAVIGARISGVGFKWQGDATDLDGLAGTGLESINDESLRWSMPITGGITVRF